MSLWGLTDALASAPKGQTKTVTFDASDAAVVVVASNTIVLSEHRFVTGDGVTYNKGAGGTVITGLTDATLYYVNRVDANTIKLYDTKARAVTGHASTGLKGLTGVGVATVHTFQRTPDDIYFIDATEASLKSNRDKGFQSPGWYQYSTYSDADSVVRHKAEHLVAFGDGAVAGASDAGVDGTDDAVAFDRELTITSISAPAVDLASDADIVATVVAAQSGVAGGTITFQWQKSTDAGANFANITADAAYTNVTTAVLTVTGSTVSDKAGEQYRCVVSLELALPRTSLPVIATQSA